MHNRFYTAAGWLAIASAIITVPAFITGIVVGHIPLVSILYSVYDFSILLLLYKRMDRMVIKIICLLDIINITI